MHELDLIPEDYHRLCVVRRGLKRLGIVSLLLLLCVIVSKVNLNNKISGITNKISELEQQQEHVSQQEEKLAVLLKNREIKEKQLQFINMLEQGGGVSQIFLVLDRAIDKNVWFTAWQFQAKELIKVSSDADSIDVEPMKIKISGQAIDNTALSIFVDRLISQPEIEDVIVNKTIMVNRDSTTINFDMDIL